MFKNFLRIGFRNLLKYKAFSAINIGGLAIGFTCCILILLYVQYELSYDRFHNDAQRIYRIAWMSDAPQTRTPHPMAQALARDFAEVESAVSLSPTWGPGLTRPKYAVRYKNKQFEEGRFIEADSTFFDIFSFELLRGDSRSVLRSQGDVVITEEIAQKYFANEDPVGKTLVVDFGGDFPLTVSGVVENMQANSHFHFDFLISYMTFKAIETSNYYEWADFGHYNYIKLSRKGDATKLEAQLNEWAGGYLGWSKQQLESLRERGIQFALQPMLEIHLHSKLKWELESNGDIAYIYIFSATALFILLIACINFMNLSTARSSNRAKEVGVRKAVGATRIFLIKQFLGESMLTAALAAMLAVAMAELLIPFFNLFAGVNLESNLTENPALVVTILAVTFSVGILSGSYPAFLLSAFQPITVLTGKWKGGSKATRFRQILVVLQFTISIVLISGTLVVSSQLDFIRNKNLGFQKEQVLIIPIKDPGMRSKSEFIKNELTRHPKVLAASTVSNVPGSRFNQNNIRWEPASKNVSIAEFRVDYGFFETLGIEIKQGRAFSRAFSTDSAQAFILNEAAARQFDWDTPLDKEISWLDDAVTYRGRVIGVVSDFHFKSLHQSISPMAFQILPAEFNYMLLKVDSDDLNRTIAFLDQKWSAFDPGHTFEYSFLDDNFRMLYRAEEKMQTIFSCFTGLAIFIACLGLLGLASYSADQRRKEIGIRKVLGASVSGVVTLLSRDFVRLVLIANVIAWPIAYLVMNDWLQNFAYRIELGPASFLTAGGVACLVAVLTVAYQAVRAALANPVDSLRYE